jgi:hypothetical protein
MELSVYVYLVFIAATIATVLFLYKASGKSKAVLGVSLTWLLIQGIVSYTGFYEKIDGFPPRFALLLLPPLVLIAWLFNADRGRAFISKFDGKWLTYLHVVRIPVEMVLFWLFVGGYVPELMTFDGINFDILSGITAPLVAYFGIRRSKMKKKYLMLWNFICLGLLFNIVINAILSAPSVFQAQAYDQPNIGVFYFPFVWLPCFIVPAVLFSHLVCLKKLKSIS